MHQKSQGIRGAVLDIPTDGCSSTGPCRTVTVIARAGEESGLEHRDPRPGRRMPNARVGSQRRQIEQLARAARAEPDKLLKRPEVADVERNYSGG